MYFRILQDAATGRVSYLLADLEAAEAVLVDPQAQDEPVLCAMLDEHRLQLRSVLLTREDRDAFVPTQAQPMVQGRDRDVSVVRGDRPHDVLLPFGGELVRVLSTPGLTPHGLSFLWRDRLFCGDLLSDGATPGPLIHPQALWDSVTAVLSMPDETLLFSGMALQGRMVSTVLEQRQGNPRFAGVTRDEFLARMVAAASTPPALRDASAALPFFSTFPSTQVSPV